MSRDRQCALFLDADGKSSYSGCRDSLTWLKAIWCVFSAAFPYSRFYAIYSYGESVEGVRFVQEGIFPEVAIEVRVVA